MPSTDRTSGDRSPTRRRPRLGLSLPALAVLAVLTAFVVGSFLARREIGDDQEEARLLDRVEEVEAFLGAAIGSTETSQRLLGQVYAIEPDPDLFAELGASVSPFPGSLVAIVEPNEGDFIAVAGAGAIEVGEPIAEERQEYLQEAIEADGLVTRLFPGEEGSRLAFASPVPGGAGVILQELPFAPTQPVAEADNPFRELRAAVYIGPEARSDQLFITTEAELPVAGATIESRFEVGAQEWLIVASAREPLMGALAYAMPTVILVAGMTVTLLATAFVEVVSRRRWYADALVAERTATLEEALTELETARGLAEAANNSKSEFVSRMSHELRTPLNAVLGFAQMLEMDDLTEDQRDSTHQILKGGRHLLDLINEILDLSRIEAGAMSLSPEPVLVGDLLGEAADLIRPLADEAGVTLSVDRSDATRSYVMADRQRTKQILLNLLSNAVKYNRPHGTITVTCDRPAQGTLRLEVRDTGRGLRPDQLELLFTPFERLGAEVEGAGIGLALSKRLAELMAGDLGVTSRPGEGSRFWCDLPEVEGPVERLERLESPDEEPVAVVPVDASPVVLHIEDNAANVKLIERILARYPHPLAVVPAMQGRLGLDLAREHHPAVILLDVHLPDITGEEVLDRLGSDPITASIPVIMLSADATPHRIERLLAAGATAYLTKPIDVRELLQVLDEALHPSPLP
jgi:signal transduction histidine kinase/ActR/RegA family two-component response regulator